MARNRLRPLERHQIAAVARIARVVVFVAFELRVAFRVAGAFFRRLGDVHALRQVLADAGIRRRHQAIGRPEVLRVGKQHVAKEVAALHQRRRGDAGWSWFGPAMGEPTPWWQDRWATWACS